MADRSQPPHVQQENVTRVPALRSKMGADAARQPLHDLSNGPEPKPARSVSIYLDAAQKRVEFTQRDRATGINETQKGEPRPNSDQKSRSDPRSASSREASRHLESKLGRDRAAHLAKEVPPPSPNMAKRPRSVSMEVIAAHDKKSRANSSGSTSATSISSAHNAEFVKRLAVIDVPKPAVDSRTELEDERDPQMCEEYAPEIFEYMYDIQEKFMVDPTYIGGMPADHRWPKNRRTLMNWSSTVHRKFHSVAETSYLAVNIIDRFLSANIRQATGSSDVLPLGQVQLLAAASSFIAAKYEEVMSPAIGNFAFIANCQDEAIRSMEKQVLITINFDLGVPCPSNFSRRISKADDYDMNTRTVAKFSLEISLFEPSLMVYRPSDVAAGAMLASQLILEAVYNEQQSSSEDSSSDASSSSPSDDFDDDKPAGPGSNTTDNSQSAVASTENRRASSRPPPSHMASVSAGLVGIIERPMAWNPAFEYYSNGLRARTSKPIVMHMVQYLRGPCEKQDPDFIKKYSSRKALSAAISAMEWARNSYEDDDDTHMNRTHMNRPDRYDLSSDRMDDR